MQPRGNHCVCRYVTSRLQPDERSRQAPVPMGCGLELPMPFKPQLVPPAESLASASSARASMSASNFCCASRLSAPWWNE